MIKYIPFLFFIILLSSSCNENNNKRKKIGTDFVEAKFIKDSLIDGEAYFYDSEGKLNSKANYRIGIKNGKAITYYKNGKVKDSSNYSNNLLNGTAYVFEEDGSLHSKTTYYYGLNVGDNYFYEGGKVYNYFLNSFDHSELVNCKYDSLGSCKYFYFNAQPVIIRLYGSTSDSVNSFFLFFPHPPDFLINYNMGLVNDKGIKEEEFVLNSDRIFIDTIFSVPTKGWKYFISIDYKNISNDSLINLVNKKF